MPISISWIIEDKLLMVKMIGEVTMEELNDLTQNSLDILSQSAGEVHHQIIDLSETTKLPSHIKEIGDLTRPVNEHEAMGWVIMFGIKNQLLKFIATMATQLSRGKVKVVDSYDDALDTLKRVDAQLTNIS